VNSQRAAIQYLILSCIPAAVLIGISTLAFGGDVTKPVPPREASFQIKSEFTVKVPKGAKSVRMWFAVPQEDAVSAVHDFNVHADFPVHYFRDDWGNRVGYAELNAPAEGPITFREEFGLTRTEIRNRIDPAKTRHPATFQSRRHQRQNQIALRVHHRRRNESDSSRAQDL
jgi:hypothetical protein